MLQLLQDRRYWPLGSSKQRDAAVRIIAATNVDLEQSVAARRFREDLYYRLNVLVIEVPSLRERREDIGPLADAFAEKLAGPDGHPMKLARYARATLATMEWPGNVRELASAFEVWRTVAAPSGAMRRSRSSASGRSSPGHRCFTTSRSPGASSGITAKRLKP